MSEQDQRLRLTYDQGTILIEGLPETNSIGLPGVLNDPRSGLHRAQAIHYRAIVETLIVKKIPYDDQARAYSSTPWPLRVDRNPFPHQTEAIQEWARTGKRGTVVLPTGTGKTFTAALAIQDSKRPTLIVTPTIDLLTQWYHELTINFGVEIGRIGGGEHEIQPITVTTYDSARIHMERIGNRFGLLIFDECHHLPSESASLAATCSLAPFRLGLTATPERADEAHARNDFLIGPVIYRREITELTGQYLANYDAQVLYVQLSEDERSRYESCRETYRRFIQDYGIDMRRPGAWNQFLRIAHRTPEGRQAFVAFRDQREIAMAAPAKLKLLARLLDRHHGDRIIIFTHDNATVYTIARQFLVPVITHQTKPKERRDILTRFNDGTYPIVATARVLNEGVNVPEANVAIVLSGTGTVREHVQRLGRILRKSGDKQAMLYEVVTKGTVEEFTSNRRRQHEAYGG